MYKMFLYFAWLAPNESNKNENQISICIEREYREVYHPSTLAISDDVAHTHIMFSLSRHLYIGEGMQLKVKLSGLSFIVLSNVLLPLHSVSNTKM
jgi:hypothetical protein